MSAPRLAAGTHERLAAGLFRLIFELLKSFPPVQKKKITGRALLKSYAISQCYSLRRGRYSSIVFRRHCLDNGLRERLTGITH